MAKRISDYPAKSTFSNNDLYDCSSEDGAGGYISQKVTGKQLREEAVRQGVLRYRALLSQTGVSDASIVVLENNLGFTPAITYSDVGQQTVVLGFSPAANKTIIRTGSIDGQIGNSPLSSGSFKIYTNTYVGVASNNLLNNTYLEIDVYP